MEPQFYSKSSSHIGQALLLAIPVSLLLWLALIELIF